jgi:cytochrome c biogenesis protein ResB
MKVKLSLLSILAIASIVVTLLALSTDGISQAAADGEVEQADIESLYDG